MNETKQNNNSTHIELNLSFIEDLFTKITSIENQIEKLADKVLPKQEWFDLKTSCRLKGICYNTVASNHRYQPNQGKPDAIICGRKRWRRVTILEWLNQTDNDLPKKSQLHLTRGGVK